MRTVNCVRMKSINESFWVAMTNSKPSCRSCDNVGSHFQRIIKRTIVRDLSEA